MPVIDFTAEDFLRGKIVEPAWYRVKVGNLSESLSKAGDSTNLVFEDSKILCNADTGSQENTGVMVSIRFNTKAKGFMIGFLQALGAELTPGARFELKAAEDKEVDIFIGNKMYEGRLQNDVTNQYRTAK